MNINGTSNEVYFTSYEDSYYTHYDFGFGRVYPRGAPPPPDYVQDTKEYPNSAVGRLVSPIFGGNGIDACTATLVGKRHIITASHCAPWLNFQDDSPPDNMVFEVAYNFWSPYRDANVLYSYWLVKNSGPSWTQGNRGGDWLVGVLDRDMENTNGYFGQQLYNPQWDGQYLWAVLGYPLSISDGMRQMSQGPLAVTKVENAEYGEIYTVGGFFQKASGAPLYGNIESEYRILGINAGPNNNEFQMTFHGGLAMFQLIEKAKTEYP
jgi:hypothetical protein